MKACLAEASLLNETGAYEDGRTSDGTSGVFMISIFGGREGNCRSVESKETPEFKSKLRQGAPRRQDHFPQVCETSFREEAGPECPN